MQLGVGDVALLALLAAPVVGDPVAVARPRRGGRGSWPRRSAGRRRTTCRRAGWSRRAPRSAPRPSRAARSPGASTRPRDRRPPPRRSPGRSSSARSRNSAGGSKRSTSSSALSSCSRLAMRGTLPARVACSSRPAGRVAGDEAFGRVDRVGVPARAGAADRVEGEAGDDHPGVFGVGVDGDPLAGAGFAPGLEAGRVERAFEEAAAVQGEADRARAVVAGRFEGAVAAAPDVGGGGDRVGRFDRGLDRLRRRAGGDAGLAFGDEFGGSRRGSAAPAPRPGAGAPPSAAICSEIEARLLLSASSLRLQRFERCAALRPGPPSVRRSGPRPRRGRRRLRAP